MKCDKRLEGIYARVQESRAVIHELDDIISKLDLPCSYHSNLLYARMERLRLLNMDLAIISSVTSLTRS